MDKQLDIITTSLEALLQRGTSPKNVGRDSAAIDAFCGLVKKETECIPTAAKLIVSKMQSMQEWEALQALQLLESCMLHCGPLFHAEVGKFRFLNELIKLISPKYLGNLTPESVRTEIIQLLFLWTMDYPKETKIREAYEMLKKQRVVQSDPIISNRRAPPPPYTPTPSTPSCSSLNQSGLSNIKPPPGPTPPTLRSSSSILEDENQSKLLQKLLQSKKPEDLQAANKLIKSMVSEEERKMEQRCKVMLEMESINNNASLLTEMLDNYTGNDPNDWDLIKELHGTCEGFRSTLVTLAQHLPSGDDDLFQLVISTNESLSEVLAKYTSTLNNLASIQTNTPLLDMSSARPSPQHAPAGTGTSHLNDLVDLITQESSISSPPPPPSSSTSSSADFPPPNTNNNVDLLQDLLSNPQQQQADVQLLNFTSENPPALSYQSTMLPNQLPSNQIPSSTVLSSGQPLQISQTAAPNSNLSSSTTAASNTFSSLTQQAFAAASNNDLVPSTSLLNLPNSNSSSSSLLHTTSSIPTSTSVLDSTSSINNMSRISSSNVLPTSSVPTNSQCGLSTSSVSLSQSQNVVPLDLISNTSLLSNSTCSGQNNLDLTHSNGLGSSNLISNGLGSSSLLSNGLGNLNTTVNPSSAASTLNFNHLSSISSAPGGLSQNKNISSASSGQNVHFMNKNSVGVRSPSTVNKLKALKDLDELVGESLNRLGLNEESASAASQVLTEKEGTNPASLAGSEETNQASLVVEEGTSQASLAAKEETKLSNGGEGGEDDEQLLLDDFMLEETGEKKVANENRDKDQTPSVISSMKSSTLTVTTPPCDNPKLADINVQLEDILPSEIKPIQAMSDVNSITILVHCTRTRPKHNIPVFVITTMSKHKTTLSRYLFQPVVPKGYKVRLQPPSSTSLPAFNPFLPSPAITQIMLIACPIQSMTTLSQTNTLSVNPSTLISLQENGQIQNTTPSHLENTPNSQSSQGSVSTPNNISFSPGNTTPSESSNLGNASNLVNLQGNGPNMDQTCQNNTHNLVNLQGTSSNMESVQENTDTLNRGNISNIGPLSKNQSSNEVSCSISLKFVVSYEIDGETVSEMGEIQELPLSEL